MAIDFSQLNPEEFNGLVRWAQGEEEPTTESEYQDLAGRYGIYRGIDPGEYSLASKPQRNDGYEGVGGAIGKLGAPGPQLNAKEVPQESTPPQPKQAIPTTPPKKKSRHARDMSVDEMGEYIAGQRAGQRGLNALDKVFSKLTPEQMEMLVKFASGEELSFGPAAEKIEELKKRGINVKDVRLSNGNVITGYEVGGKVYDNEEEAVQAMIERSRVTDARIQEAKELYGRGEDIDLPPELPKATAGDWTDGFRSQYIPEYNGE